jgi:hypothetical protein
MEYVESEAAGQFDDLVTLGCGEGNHLAPDETGGTGDSDLHVVLLNVDEWCLCLVKHEHG